MKGGLTGARKPGEVGGAVLVPLGGVEVQLARARLPRQLHKWPLRTVTRSSRTISIINIIIIIASSSSSPSYHYHHHHHHHHRIIIVIIITS
eukprot:4566828-Pyramimonas_sp.AAC.1